MNPICLAEIRYFECKIEVESHPDTTRWQYAGGYGADYSTEASFNVFSQKKCIYIKTVVSNYDIITHKAPKQEI